MIKLKIFSSGKNVFYKGKLHTVDYVTVSGMDLIVTFREVDFRGLPIKADADKIQCEPTVMMVNPDRNTKHLIRRHKS